MILPRHGTSLTVMIVEDDADDAFLLQRAFKMVARQGGFHINLTFHHNGWEALGAVAQRDIVDDLPDLAVVDLNMPVMDGMRFLDRLRGEFRLPQLPAFVLTTSDRPEIHARAREMGADRVFVKPDSPDAYIDVIAEMIEAVLAAKAAA